MGFTLENEINFFFSKNSNYISLYSFLKVMQEQIILYWTALTSVEIKMLLVGFFGCFVYCFLTVSVSIFFLVAGVVLCFGFGMIAIILMSLVVARQSGLSSFSCCEAHRKLGGHSGGAQPGQPTPGVPHAV